ncbi:hypothetical protein EOE18_12270 [Novosphingobium umbonatum]|uniref:Uncharacterized protein n=1 Tax=Novosphingobium umbonatum TaxID=1908524 RepID=A0A3S2Y5X4_9SPHN|nr:hypothetical protein [Novosphingobium umbonatum]RVU04266.1 hypothetical protein EOE18_12270 [Novosphingobium umbonatum]
MVGINWTDHARCMVAANWWSDPSQCWYEWQSLLGGVLAVLAAGLTILVTRCQMKQAERHKQDELASVREQMEQVENQRLDEIRRRHNAARIGMPFAVSEISAMCHSMADKLLGEMQRLDVEAEHGEPDEVAVNPDILKTRRLDEILFPASVASSFREFTETLTNDTDICHISELMSQLQILCARWASFDFSEILAKDRLLSLLFDVAKVGYLNDCLFNYVRGLESKGFGVVGVISYEDAWKGIGEKVFSLIFDRPDIFDFGKINAMLKRRREDGSSPWLEKFEVE